MSRSPFPISLARRSRFGVALALVALVPATAAAQNCLGFRLDGGQHAFGGVIDERGEFGGGGLWYAGLLKNGVSLHGDFTKHEVDVGSAYEYMQMGTGRVSFPVLRSASVNDQPNGLCGFAELGFSSFQEASSSHYGVGVGYTMNMKRLSLFAGPVLGQASAGDASDSYVNFIGSATARFGFFMIGAQTTQPIQPEGAKGFMAIRAGFAIGRASAITKPWARTPDAAAGAAGAAGPAGVAGAAGAALTGVTGAAGTSGATAPAVAQTGAAASSAGAAGPTAGLKPYSLEDIEAMVRNNVAASRILDLAHKACVDFRMGEATETRLRRVGADQALIDGLKTRCYSAT